MGSVGAPGNDGSAAVAGLLLLLPVRGVRRTGLLPVARAHLGTNAEPPAGLPRLEGPCAPSP